MNHGSFAIHIYVPGYYGGTIYIGIIHHKRLIKL